MRHPNVPDELTGVLEAVASENGWRIGYDTHYDAANAELWKWVGRSLHRLDFQPFPPNHIEVIYTTERYPFFPRLCRWISPKLGTRQWRTLGQLKFGQSASEYEQTIRAYVQSAA